MSTTETDHGKIVVSVLLTILIVILIVVIIYVVLNEPMPRRAWIIGGSILVIVLSVVGLIWINTGQAKDLSSDQRTPETIA